MSYYLLFNESALSLHFLKHYELNGTFNFESYKTLHIMLAHEGLQKYSSGIMS